MVSDPTGICDQTHWAAEYVWPSQGVGITAAGFEVPLTKVLVPEESKTIWELAKANADLLVEDTCQKDDEGFH